MVTLIDSTLDFFPSQLLVTLFLLLCCPFHPLLWEGSVSGWFPVEAVMLRQEQDVEDHRKDAQEELGGVTKHQLPLI